jgi:hypothetical protein
MFLGVGTEVLGDLSSVDSLPPPRQCAWQPFQCVVGLDVGSRHRRPGDADAGVRRSGNRLQTGLAMPLEAVVITGREITGDEGPSDLFRAGPPGHV